ncbi:MAG: sigma factor-like helix-turn-helix DNA-binding protein [Bacilli bacterium]|nr:sigma factor-like helix-turn-helix DNA-binding protein [Bacilli bacterium]
MEKNERKSEQLCVKVVYPSSLIFDIFGCKFDDKKYSDMIVKAEKDINKSEELLNCIAKIKNNLNEKQKQIFDCLYEKDLTLNEIMNKLSLSLNMVTRLEKDLVRELRNPKNAKKLIQFLPEDM